MRSVVVDNCDKVIIDSSIVYLTIVSIAIKLLLLFNYITRLNKLNLDRSDR